MTSPRRRLATALHTKPANRCPDGCETTRALFAAAIEREMAGEDRDEALYARLDACPACAAEYIAALDLAYRLDRDPLHAANAPAIKLPLGLRLTSRPRDEDQGGLRRVAEDTPPYGDDQDD